MAGIFVSYRRQDRPIATRFLVAKLDQHYGSDHVFHDLDDIDIGEHFLDRIKRALESSAVLLAVIGPDWLRNYRDRLHREGDPVRLEISSALRKQGVLVVPVLLSSARMPELEDLPEDMRELHYKNAVSLRSADLDADIERLMERLDRIPSLGQAAQQQRPNGADQPDDEVVRTRPLSPQSTDGHEPPRFSLVEESSRRIIEFEGECVQLTRDLLDPGNSALSNRGHARVERLGDNWFVSDLSSNRATFVQIDEEMELEEGDWLLLGATVYEFSAEGLPGGDRTVSLAQLDRRLVGEAAATLQLSPLDGEPLQFQGEEIRLNRDSLAPGDTSLSRSRHACFSIREGRWYLKDLSSNRASFLQARRKMLLCPGSALVLGGRLYTFRPAGDAS